MTTHPYGSDRLVEEIVYNFGDPVRFRYRLVRKAESRQIGDRYNGSRLEHRKFWERAPLDYGANWFSGIVVGKRTLANGRIHYDYDAGPIWHPDSAEHFTAYLVAYDLRRNHVMVLPEDLTPITKEN